MSEHYDVIIIGTGAGGGTLAHRLAPSGKRILLLERGGYLPREPENWDSEEVFGKERYVTGEEWIRQGRRSRSARTRSTSSAATRSSTARSCSACASATSARSATTAASRPRGRSPTTTSSPTTPRPSGSTSCTARPARTRPSRRARARSRTRPSRTSRASSSCTTTSRATGHQPFHLPVGVDLNESDPEAGPLRALRPLRRLPLPDRRQGRRPRAAACGPRSSTPTSRCARHAKVERLETDASGRSVDRGGRRARRQRGDLQRRRRRRRPAARSTPPALLLRSASDAHPNGLANSLRRRRPPLHGPHQLGRDRDLADAEPDASSRRRSASTTTTGAPTDFELPLGHIQMLGKSRPQHPARAARRGSPRASRSTTWPSTRSTSGSRPRTCPHPDNRVTVDRQGRIHLAKTYHNDEPHRRLLAKLKGLLGARSAATSA